jgi:predicted GIY-YIG superfamily endonuclease
MDEHETLAFYTKVLQSRLGRYEQRTYLYYYFDIDRLLLYVGVTDDLETRTKAHEKSSAWMRFVSYRRVAVLFSREYAEWVERKEIQEKNPLFNVAHSNPGYEQRLVDYLVSKNALNLLAPIRKTARDSPELA